MGHPNEDRIRTGYEAFSGGDFAALNELFADDIVWHLGGRNQLSGDHSGKEAVFGVFAKSAELTGGTFRLDIHDVLANDEHGVALVTASGERDGKRLEDRQVHVFHISDGIVTEHWSHTSDQYTVDEFLS